MEVESQSISLKTLFTKEETIVDISDTHNEYTVQTSLPPKDAFDSLSYASSEKKLKKNDKFEIVKEGHIKEIFRDLTKAQEYMKKYESYLLRLYKSGHLQRILQWRDINYNAIHTDLHKQFVQIVAYFMHFHGEDLIPSWLMPPLRKKKNCRAFLSMIDEARNSVLKELQTTVEAGTKRKRIEEATDD